jgi:hypothetical protein
MDTPAPLTPPSQEQLDALEITVQSRSEALGELQAELAGLVDAMLDRRREGVKLLRDSLKKQSQKLLKSRGKVVAGLVKGVGDTVGEFLAPRFTSVAMMSQAAATGMLPAKPELITLIPPDPPPSVPNPNPVNPSNPPVAAGGSTASSPPAAGGIAAANTPAAAPPTVIDTSLGTWTVWARCSDMSVDLQLQTAVIPYNPNPASQGYTQVTQFTATTSPIADQQQGNQLGQAWLAANCPATTPVSTASNPPLPPPSVTTQAAASPPVASTPPAAPSPAPVVSTLPPAQQTALSMSSLQPVSCNYGTASPVVEAKSYCDYLESIISWCNGVSGSLTAAGNGSSIPQWINEATLQSLLNFAFGGLFNPTQLLSTVASWEVGVGACDLLSQWLVSLKAVICDRIADAQSVLAVKCVLTMWQKLSVNAGQSKSTSSSVSITTSIPGLSYLSGSIGGGGNAGDGSSAGFSTGFAAALVPALDLLDMCISYLCPHSVMGIGEAITCFLAEQMTVEDLDCITRIHGQRPGPTHRIVRSQRGRISEEERIEYGYRHSQTEQELRHGLREYGYIDSVDIDRRLELWFSVATPGQIDRFQTWGTSYAPTINAYGLDSGFNDLVWPAWGQAYLAQGVSHDLAKHMWISHWHPPGIGDLQQMLYRLNPAVANTPTPFTESDYANWIGVHGHPPWINQRLAAIAYQPVSLRYLRSGLDLGTLGLADATATLSAQGYAPATVTALAAGEITASARRRAKAYGGYTLQNVVKMVHGGVLTRPQATTALTGQGYSDAEIDAAIDVHNNEYISGLEEASRHEALRKYADLVLSAYRDGAVDRPTALSSLLSLAYLETAANLELDAIDLANRQKTVNEAVKNIRRSFLLGAVNAAEANNALAFAGVTPAMAATYTARWTLELTTPRVAVNGATVIRLAKKGLISVPNATIRLQNLGYTQDAIATELLDIQQSLLAAQNALAAKNAKALQQAQTAAQKLITQSQKQLCKIYSPGKLVKWYSMRVIQQPELLARLTSCGYTAEAAQNLLAEAVQARAKVDAATAKAAAEARGLSGKPLSASELIKLFSIRIIDEPALTAGLEAIGATGSVLSEYQKEAAAKLAANDALEASKGASAGEYTGPGAVPGGPAP